MLRPKVNFKELKNIYKKKSDKKGQGSLVAIILASVIGTIIVGSVTQWYLSMNKTMSGTNDRLEAMTIAMSEWQRLEHMSLDELEANRENYKNPYDVGEKFKVGVTLGEQGFFDEGKCNSLTGTYAGENANCFKDTIMTVYDKDGNAMYTTRSLPLSVSRDSFPEGTILPYTGDLAKIPHGWVLCDGTNGTPDLRGKFLEGTATNTGVFKMAGLPNLTGQIVLGENIYSGNELGGNRAFYLYNTYDTPRNYRVEGPGSGAAHIVFNANRENPIYGASETVQPPSYTVFYIMKTNKDFHYNHTNGAPAPNVYTKEEVDSLLEKERAYNNTNYLNKSSKEYVHNLFPDHTLALGYNGGDETIHGYYDGKEAPFAGSGSMGYPDYENGVELSFNKEIVITEEGWILWNCGISTSSYSELFINGKTFSILSNTGGNTYWSEDSSFVPVKKGDIVIAKGSPTYRTFYFYPNLK